MRYSDNLDYLVGAIIYLGTSTYWWGRTPTMLGRELNWDPAKLQELFKAFPGLFKRSKQMHLNKELNIEEYSYSLQARYAQYKSKHGEEPQSISDIPPVDMDKLKVVIDFVQKMAESEQIDKRAKWTNRLVGATAVLSAMTTVTVGIGVFKPSAGPTDVRVEFKDAKK